MALGPPTLPIITNKDIENAYVSLQASDVIYTDFETSRLLTITTADTLATSVCSVTASLTGSNSSSYYSTRMTLFNRGFEESYTGLTGNIGIYQLKKRFFDVKIKNGSLTAAVTGAHADDYYDSGSGALVRKSNGVTYGAFLNDEGMFVVTSASSSLTSIVQSITSLKYRAIVQNTELSVFCKCQPNEMNFTLNPSAFNITAGGNYMTGGLTGSSNNAEFFPDLVSSGIAWQPHISSIGLYDDDNNLLAVGKLTRPMRKSTDIPVTIRVQLDI